LDEHREGGCEKEKEAAIAWCSHGLTVPDREASAAASPDELPAQIGAARHATGRQLFVFRAVKSNDISLMFTTWQAAREHKRAAQVPSAIRLSTDGGDCRALGHG
jgi:hypothetical protein